jgi:hypothetical protein
MPVDDDGISRILSLGRVAKSYLEVRKTSLVPQEGSGVGVGCQPEGKSPVCLFPGFGCLHGRFSVVTCAGCFLKVVHDFPEAHIGIV